MSFPKLLATDFTTALKGVQCWRFLQGSCLQYGLHKRTMPQSNQSQKYGIGNYSNFRLFNVFARKYKTSSLFSAWPYLRSDGNFKGWCFPGFLKVRNLESRKSGWVGNIFGIFRSLLVYFPAIYIYVCPIRTKRENHKTKWLNKYRFNKFDVFMKKQTMFV